MMTIPTKSLKFFKAKASKISPNKISPICSYLLFDFKDGTCTITKTNNDAFVVETFSADGEGKILVDEGSVFDFVGYNKGEFLSFEKSDNIVKLSCEKARGESPTDDPTLFPHHESPEGDGITLTPAVISEIKTAAKMILVEEVPTPRSFVFVGNGLVSGSDAIVAYYYKTDIQTKIVLRKEVADAIPDNGCVYFSGASYDFFVAGDSTFGFVKDEFPFTDMNKYALYEDGKGFLMGKGELINFNDWAVASSPNKGVVSRWEIKGAEMFLESKDVSVNKGVEKTLEYTGKADGGFSFRAESMSKLLKNLPGEELFFFQEKDKYYITDVDRSFTSLIMRII